MTTTIDGKWLKIQLSDVIDSLQGADRTDLIERLACETDIILAVADLIIDGFTANGSSPWKPTLRLRSVPQTAIDAIRMYIADKYNEIAGDEFRLLKESEQKFCRQLGEMGEKYANLRKEYNDYKDEAERLDQNKTYRLNKIVNAIQEGIEKYSAVNSDYMISAEFLVDALRQIKGYE